MIWFSLIIGYIVSVIILFLTKDKGHNFIEDGDIFLLAIFVDIVLVWMPIYALLNTIYKN